MTRRRRIWAFAFALVLWAGILPMLHAPARAAAPSSDLADYLTSVIIEAPTDAGGNYVVQTGSSYEVHLTFAESTAMQFPDGGTMTYTLPEGFTAANGTSDTVSFDISYVEDGVVHTATVSGNTWSVQNGVLTFTWNESDPNFSHLTAAGNASFSIDISGSFDGSQTHIEFSDTLSQDITVNDPHDLDVSKSGTFNKTTGKVEYTVKVVSEGTNTDVSVTDALSGTALTLDTDSISASSSVSGAIELSSLTGSASADGFTYTIPSMRDGEVITFTYTASVDLDAIGGANAQGHGTYDQTYNNVTATSDENPDSDSDAEDLRNEINYTSTDKSAGAVSVDADDPNKKTVPWTMTVNKEKLAAMGGKTVTDTIGTSSRDIMKYSGDGIQVVVTDVNGNTVRTDTIPWDQLESHSDTGWTYKIPETDTEPYQYVITYTTEVDLTGNTNEHNYVTNIGRGPGGSTTGSSDVGSGTSKTDVEKEIVSADEESITWRVTFTVPAEGLDSAVVTDTYPSYGILYTQYQDTLDHEIGEDDITGLVEGETWAAEYQTDRAVITFYKDGNGTPGLVGTGSERQVTIDVTTKVNADWLAAGKSGTSILLQTHTNSVTLTANGDEHTDSVGKRYTGQGLTKSGSGIDERSAGWFSSQTYYGADFDIVLSGVSDESFDENGYLVVSDVFNTDYLKLRGTSMTIYAADNLLSLTIWPSASKSFSTYETTSTGMDIMVGTGTIPKKSDGSYYAFYRIRYTLEVKDIDALKAYAATQTGGVARLTNTATWGEETGKSTVTYTYKMVDKACTVSGNGTSEVTAAFTITLNPDAQDLDPNSDTVELVDTFENFAVDYTSIKVQDTRGNDISSATWDTSGNTIVFSIPDETAIVISYSGRVLSSGAITNTATLRGQKADHTEEVEVTTGGGGTASVYAIHLLKYKAGNQNDRLAGAVFELYDSNGSPVTGKDGSTVTFTTPETGLLTIVGDQAQDGWSLQADTLYRLKEVTAPTGYQLAANDYYFQISSDGSVSYGSPNWKYFNGDTMTVKNYEATSVSFSKQWVDEDGTAYTPAEGTTIIVQLQQSIDGGSTWQDDILAYNGSAWSGTSVRTVSAGDDWKGTFEGLPTTVTCEVDGKTVDAAADYRVTETLVNGVTPAALGYTATVTGSAADGYTITNTYTNPLRISIGGSKVLQGREMTEADVFTFVLTALDEGHPGMIGETATAINDENAAFSFTLDFDDPSLWPAAGDSITYYYTVTEEHAGELIDNVLYSDQTFWVAVTLRNTDGIVTAEQQAYTRDPRT